MLRSIPRLICHVQCTIWCILKNVMNGKQHFEHIMAILSMMPFNFTNAHAIFQHLINNPYNEYLDKFVVYYIINILILFKNMEDHEHDVHIILDKFM
jgi:hypothetical protein